MATPNSQTLAPRTVERRRATREEALDHAEAIVAEQGPGAVTVSEIARRMGMRAPSLYKHFPSLHAIHDGLFERGWTRLLASVEDAIRGHEPGLDSLRPGVLEFVRWCTAELGLAPLLLWRPVPGFEPSPSSYAPSLRFWALGRAQLRAAVDLGELDPAADTDEAQRLLSAGISGVCSQQLANQPGASFEDGEFSSLTSEVLAMFIDHYTPGRTDLR